MAIARCRVCDASVGEADRYCASCGAPVASHVTVVDLADPSPQGQQDQRPGGSNGLIIGLVLASLAVVALGASLALGPRDRSSPSEAAAESEPDEPSPTGSDRSTSGSPSTSPPPAGGVGVEQGLSEPLATVAPEATSTDPMASSVDVSALPSDLGATHLAVRGFGGVTFIDLSTGERRHTTHGFGAVTPTIRAVSGGVVTVGPDGLLLFRSDGTKDVLFARRALRLVGVRDDVVVVLDPVDVTSLGPTVRGVTMEGSVEWSIALPASVQVAGVVDGRTIVVDAAGTIMLLQPGAPPRPLFSGRVVAVGSGHVIGYWCDQQLICATRVLDLGSGTVAVVGDEETFFDPDTWSVSPDGRMLAGLTFGMGGRRLARVDVDAGGVVAVGPDEAAAYGEVVDWDPSGSYVLTGGRTLELVDIESGARHPLDLDSTCCRDGEAITLVG